MWLTRFSHACSHTLQNVVEDTLIADTAQTPTSKHAWAALRHVRRAIKQLHKHGFVDACPGTQRRCGLSEKKGGCLSKISSDTTVLPLGAAQQRAMQRLVLSKAASEPVHGTNGLRLDPQPKQSERQALELWALCNCKGRATRLIDKAMAARMASGQCRTSSRASRAPEGNALSCRSKKAARRLRRPNGPQRVRRCS